MLALTRPVEPASRRNIVMTLGLAAIAAVAAVAWIAIRPPTSHALPPRAGQAANGLLLYEADGSLLVRASPAGPSRQLLSGTNPAAQFDPVWSPDGQRFAFVLHTGDGYGLATISADGTGIAALPVRDPLAVAWSPNGSDLAAIDGTSPPSLWVVSGIGTTAEQIRVDGKIPLAVAWRPPNGGSLLVEALGGGGRRDLYVTDPLGINVRALGLSDRLARIASVTSGAVYSPDGTTIAFGGLTNSTDPLRTHVRIWLMFADGTDVRALPGPTAGAYLETPVAFSPDGRWLLIRRSEPGRCCPVQPTEAWLAIMPADGSAPARDIGPHFMNVDATVSAAFSPDGTQILAGARTDPPSVFSIDPSTGASNRLDWTQSVPAWQRVAP